MVMAATRPLPSLWSDAAVITGLWALGGAQPLLELLGRNPTFFVAANASDARILAFLAVVLLAVPLIALTVMAVSRRLPAPVPQVVRLVLLSAGAGLFGLSIGRRLFGDSTAGHVTVALAAVVFVLVADRRWPRVVEAMRYVSVAVLVFGGLFLLSPAGALIGQADAAAVENVEIGRPDDVVLVILDELPTSSLLGMDGTIAEERFPNFARLADSSVWYRNAVSDHSYTTEAVPAMLSGQVLEDPPAPAGSNYPENIFTLLGDRYRIEAREELTSLCPPDLCTPVDSSFSQMLSDSWVVFRHQTLPDHWRASLPPVDQGWGRFENSADTAADPLDEPFKAWTQRQARVASRTAYRTEPLETLADQLREPAGATPELHVVHAVIPHRPWEREPGGALYTTSAESDVPVDTDGRWIDNEGAVTSSFQRHLLQVGHVDRLVGDVVDALETSGRWDDTLLVVVADHGVTFDPGSHRRRPNAATKDEVYRVPLFIHTPGGPRGETRDDRVHTGDLMPTVVDALEIETEWSFSGASLLDPTDGPARTTVNSRAGPVEVDPSLEPMMEVVRRNTRRLPHGEDWRSVAAPGDAGALVGTVLTDLDPRESLGPVTVHDLENLLTVDRSNGFLPVMIEATFEGEDPPEQILIAVDGAVAGAGLPQRSDNAFTIILDPSVLTDGPHEVEALAWSDGQVHAVEFASTPALAIEDGALTSDGSTIPLLDGIDLEIDKTNRVDEQIAVWGWSVDAGGERLPDTVVLFNDDEVIASDSRFTKSNDAAERHGDGFAFSRFSLRGPEAGALRVAAIYPDGMVVTDL
jgi:hypothetical protein